jgi:hypothetical protein
VKWHRLHFGLVEPAKVSDVAAQGMAIDDRKRLKMPVRSPDELWKELEGLCLSLGRTRRAFLYLEVVHSVLHIFGIGPSERAF